MGNLFKDLLGKHRIIKSIQSGEVSITGTAVTGTASISSVNVDNSILIYLGERSNWEAWEEHGARLFLTSSTVVTGQRHRFSGSWTSAIGFVVIEFYPGVIKSIQTGTITITTATSNTDTITAVDTNKAFVMSLGGYGSHATSGFCNYGTVELTNSTTVTFTLGAYTTASAWQTYQVVEFY